MEPLVSVALLTYNRVGMLRQSLQSALQQTYRNIEVMVLDDSSTDGTSEYMESITDPRVTYYRNEQERGRLYNGTRGFALARGKYLIHLCDDDLFMPDLIAREVEVLETVPGISLVCANWEMMDDEGTPLGRYHGKIRKNLVFGPGRFVEAFLKDKLFFGLSGIMLDLGYLRRNDIRITEQVMCGSDQYLACTFNMERSVCLIADPLWRYRIHSTQASQQGWVIDGAISFYEQLSEYCMRKGMDIEPLVRQRCTEQICESSIFHISTVDQFRQYHEKWLAHRYFDSTIMDSDPCNSILKYYLWPGQKLAPSSRWRISCSANVSHARWFRMLRHFRQDFYYSLRRFRKKRILIFGTRHNAALLYFLLRDIGAEIVGFIDNHPARKGQACFGLPILRESELNGMPDCRYIIVSVEGHHDVEIIQRLRKCSPKNTAVKSWKRIIKNAWNEVTSRNVICIG
jgi:glycosyltransferase involved in cell wall biosynthesis